MQRKIFAEIGWLMSGLSLAVALPMVTPDMAAAGPTIRGEKIEALPAPSSALTNPNVSATNHSATATNNIGLSPAAVVTNPLPPIITVAGDKYRSLSYQSLASFRFNVSAEMSRPDADPLVATARVLERIPGEVKTMNERAVALTGLMLPVKWNEGLVTDFMLLPNTMGCCYGRIPRINEIIIVNTSGKGVKLMKDVPVSVLGTFHVGAIRNNNYLAGIYQMDCERVVEASALNSK